MALNKKNVEIKSDTLAVHNLKGIACVNPKKLEIVEIIHTVYIHYYYICTTIPST